MARLLEAVTSTWIWKSLIPEEKDRLVVDRWDIGWVVFPATTLLMLISLLARRPNTRFYRLALAPLVIPIIFRPAFAVRWFAPHLVFWNVITTTAWVLQTVRALEFALTPSGMLRVGESSPGQGHLGDHNTWLDTIYWAFYDIADLGCNMRGIGWHFGLKSKLRLPQSTRPFDNKEAWLRQTAMAAFWPYIIFDLGGTLAERIPALETYTGLTIFCPFLPPVLRYIASTIFTAGAGIFVVKLLEFGYDATSLFSVVFLGHDPKCWPALFGQPWFAESLHEFWAVHWHQLLRRFFVLTLGYPLHFVFGRAGLVVGVFVSSGVLHSAMLNADGVTGVNWATIGFFAGQSLGLFAEQAFRKWTGKRVGGLWGNIWTVLFILITVQPAEDAWLGRQVLGARLIPRQASIVELALSPFDRLWSQ